MANIDYGYFLSAQASRRRPAMTRELAKRAYLGPKSTISMAEGVPNEISFPFEKIQIQLKDGATVTLQDDQLKDGLNYIPSQGYPPLLQTLKEFMIRIHDPLKWEDREVIMTNGSQDGISKVIEMCLEEGDPIILPSTVYTGVEVVLKPFKPEIISVDHDQNGISAQKLLNILENRKAKYTEEGGGWKMPKLIYLNPTGSNPTGTTMTLERRKEIYKICCQYNILILEDDAYCFLHFLDEQPTSFLTLDTENRVIRLDSISKVLGSGLRVAWLTGPKPLVSNIEMHIQSGYLHSSSLSQVIIDKLFRTWGVDRLLSHMSFVKEYYKARRDITLASMDRHLKGLCDWTIPTGGMFVWIKVRGVSDVYDMLMTRGLKKGVIFIPGHAFMADPTQACNCIRASYSRISPKQVDKAMRMLAELIKEEHDLLRRKLENCT